MSVTHSFSVDVACVVGDRQATILNNFSHWHLKNGEDGHHVFDGFVWTYNSIAAFAKVWPYLSAKQVRVCLDNLEKEGYLKTGNYNEWKIDQTKWYALTEKACELLKIPFSVELSHLPKRANALARKGKSNRPEGQMDLPETADGFAQKGEPIPLENQLENTLEKQEESESAGESQKAESTPLETEEEKKGAPGGAATTNVVTPESDPLAPRLDPFLRNKNAESVNVPFALWFAAYDYKINERYCKQLWVQLTDQERTTAMARTPEYVAAYPQKRYRKIPENYLIEKTFNDEIVSRHESATNPPANPRATRPGYPSAQAGNQQPTRRKGYITADDLNRTRQSSGHAVTPSGRGTISLDVEQPGGFA